MDNIKLRNLLKKTAEEQEWTSQSHLWPRVMASLPASKPKRSGFNLQHAFSALAVVMVVLGLFVTVTPAGRAFAQQVLGLFQPVASPDLPEPSQNLVNIDPQAEAAPLAGEALVDDGCGTLFTPRCSIAEVETLTGLDLLSFNPVPEGLTLRGATYKDGNAFIIYDAENGAYILRESAASTGDLKAWEVGQNASIEAVFVGDFPAEYVQGAWWPSDSDLKWEVSANQHSLRWETDSLQLSLSAGAGKVYNPLQTSRDELVRLAALLTHVEIAAVEPAKAADLGELESQLGFAIRLPQDLPAGYYLDKVQYEPATGFVCSYYKAGTTGESPFFIAQKFGALPATLYADMHADFGGTIVTGPVSVVDWELSGATQDKGQFFIRRVNGSLLCPDPEYFTSHGLAWSKDGISYGVFGLKSYLDSNAHFFLTEADMRSVAAQINDVAAPEAAFDSERFFNPKEAEQLTGKPFPMPSAMLADFNFAYIGEQREDGEVDLGGSKITKTVFLGPETAYDARSFLQIDRFAPAFLTMEEIEGWGGYEPAAVWDQPALMRTICTPVSALPGVNFCSTDLHWQADDLDYWLRVNSDVPYAHEAILQIAESMQP